MATTVEWRIQYFQSISNDFLEFYSPNSFNQLQGANESVKSHSHSKSGIFPIWGFFGPSHLKKNGSD